MASQIYSFINAVTSQALGHSAVAQSNTEDFVSLGDAVLSNVESTSAFYSALSTAIGRTYALYRSLPEQRSGIMRTPLEFGSILRTIEIDKIASVKANSSWDASASITETILNDTTDAICTYDSKRGTFEVDTKVIYDIQLREAFSDEQSMAAFIDMVFSDMYNAMEVAIRDLENTTIATGIALASQYALTSKCCINLLHEYNVAYSASKTSDTCLLDPAFLRFAAAQIKKHKKYMEDPNELYNPAGAQRWTPSNECEVQVLEEFASNCATYLESDTFHNEMVKLPTYRERSFWQGIGDGSLAQRAKIMIQRGASGSEVSTTVNGVIAYLFDREAIAVMVDFIRTKSDYKPRYEHTEYYHKCDWASLVRSTQQMIVFYIDDYYPLTVPAADVSAWATAYVNYYTKDESTGAYSAATSTYSATTQYYKKS